MATGQIQKNEAIFWVALGAFVCFLGWRIEIGTLGTDRAYLRWSQGLPL